VSGVIETDGRARPLRGRRRARRPGWAVWLGLGPGTGRRWSRRGGPGRRGGRRRRAPHALTKRGSGWPGRAQARTARRRSSPARRWRRGPRGRWCELPEAPPRSLAGCGRPPIAAEGAGQAVPRAWSRIATHQADADDDSAEGQNGFTLGESSADGPRGIVAHGAGSTPPRPLAHRGRAVPWAATAAAAAATLAGSPR